MTATAAPTADLAPSGVTHKDFDHHHVEYEPARFRTHRAFYDGQLLGDKDVMAANFFKGPREELPVYILRAQQAFYENVCGKLVDYAASGLEADPLYMAVATPKGEAAEGQDVPEMDPYYQALQDDVSPLGGRRCSLNELKHEVVLDALLHRRAWVRVDMPEAPPEDAKPMVLADQEKSGALDAYMVCIPPDCVIDWEVDGSGELLFVLTREVEARRLRLADKRNQVTERFVWYTPQGWTRYEFDYDKENKPTGPGPDEPPTRIISGVHSFGRVPIRPFELPHGLWMMSKLFPLAREHFNLRNWLSYAERRCLFAQRVAYLADKGKFDGAPANGKARDPNRAKNQVNGIGRVLEMAEKDRLEWDAPPVDSFEYALDACGQLVEAMHGVVHQMALAIKNTPSALKRSADSKAEDKGSTAVVLRALGGYLRVFFVELFELVSEGRGDGAIGWVAKGASKFDDASFSDKLVDATSWALVPGHAPTANRLFMMGLYRSCFGETVGEEDYDAMDDELEQANTVEAAAGDAEARARTAAAEYQEENPEPPKPKGKAFGK